MAELTIRFIPDPVTGKKNIHIAMKSDEDAMPHEHEQQHRNLVEKLLNRGILKADEVGDIVVTREEATCGECKESVPEPQREAQAQGG